MGQVPTLLSLPLPLQGDRRGEPPRFVSYLFLFSRDPRFQGPTEPRTPLGTPPGLLRSREERSLPATSMQLSRAEGPGLPAAPHWPPLPPPPRFLLARARTEAHASTLTGPGPLCFKHTPLPHH